MDSDRGGSVFHFLWATALVIVLLFLAVCVLAGNGKDDHRGVPGLITYQLISHHDDDGGDGNGNSGGKYEGGRSGDNDQRGDHNCRNFCFYGIPAPGGDQPPPKDQQPKGFVPPNPGKIPQQVADFVKLVADFVQSVIRFAV